MRRAWLLFTFQTMGNCNCVKGSNDAKLKLEVKLSEPIKSVKKERKKAATKDETVQLREGHDAVVDASDVSSRKSARRSSKLNRCSVLEKWPGHDNAIVSPNLAEEIFNEVYGNPGHDGKLST